MSPRGEVRTFIGLGSVDLAPRYVCCSQLMVFSFWFGVSLHRYHDDDLSKSG